ncbi:15903_t:CDS:2, partial [Entrophospora sp. SA101]
MSSSDKETQRKAILQLWNNGITSAKKYILELARRWKNESKQPKPVGRSLVHFHYLKIVYNSVVVIGLNNTTFGNVDMSEESKKRKQKRSGR